MQKDYCKEILDHLNRIEGQLKTIKKYIEEKQDCEQTLNLFSSFLESAKSVKTKILLAHLAKEKIQLTESQIKLIAKTTKI
jgi:DNA-binding FrmR family transcriptional regulator